MPTNRIKLNIIKNALIDAVNRHCMSHVPFGCIVSGGLDSSLATAIVARLFKKKAVRRDDKGQWVPRKLYTFVVGKTDSVDKIYAKKVADFLGTKHHAFEFTDQDVLDNLERIIWHLERYDVSCVRPGIPQYFLAQGIQP
eukprot:UN17358